MTMTDTGFVARRATVEDLPQLLPLWRLENLPADELEKRFSCLIRSVQAFSSDSQRFREQVLKTNKPFLLLL